MDETVASGSQRRMEVPWAAEASSASDEICPIPARSSATPAWLESHNSSDRRSSSRNGNANSRPRDTTPARRRGETVSPDSLRVQSKISARDFLRYPASCRHAESKHENAAVAPLALAATVLRIAALGRIKLITLPVRERVEASSSRIRHAGGRRAIVPW